MSQRAIPFFDISRVVRHWIDPDVLQHDRRRTPPDNAEEDVVTRPLKRDVEPETVAIERQRGGDILYDEERRNAGNFRFRQVSFPPNLYHGLLPVSVSIRGLAIARVSS